MISDYSFVHYVSVLIASTFLFLFYQPVTFLTLSHNKGKINGYVDVKNITIKDIQISEKIAKRKKELFKELYVIPKPFVGVKKLITNTLSGYPKAVVSGSAIGGGLTNQVTINFLLLHFSIFIHLLCCYTYYGARNY